MWSHILESYKYIDEKKTTEEKAIIELLYLKILIKQFLAICRIEMPKMHVSDYL